jgi:thymidine phosphorylase
MFNCIDDAVEEHAEEANSVITMAYADMNKIINHDGNKHETHTAMEILAVCKRLAEDLGALSIKATRPYVDALELDKKAQAIGAAAGNLMEAAKNKSPEWKAELDRRTEPIGTAVGSVVEVVKSKSPDWKQSVSVVRVYYISISMCRNECLEYR